MSFFCSKQLLAAKSMSGWFTPSNKELILARRLCHEGVTLREIHEALGWDCTLQTTRKRLRKFNIVAINPSDRRHDGYETFTPDIASRASVPSQGAAGQRRLGVCGDVSPSRSPSIEQEAAAR